MNNEQKQFENLQSKKSKKWEIIFILGLCLAIICMSSYADKITNHHKNSVILLWSN